MIKPLIVALVMALLALHAIAQPPSISQLLPSAVRPGETTTVTLHGEHLVGATELWTGFPARSNRVPGNADWSDRVAFQITVPKDVPAGVVPVRVATTNGISHPALLVIDDLPSRVQSGTNHSRGTAQYLALPAALDGTTTEASFDYYSLRLRRGERVSIEVVANRIGSAVDPVVRVLDAEERELAFSDDDPALGADCRFVFRAPTAGIYHLELRDLAYGGGPKHRYRLRVGRFPVVNIAFPMGARQGTKAMVQWLGPAAEGLQPVELMAPDRPLPHTLRLGIAAPRGGGSGWVVVAAGEFSEWIEKEPNDDPGKANPVSLPLTINGRLERARDRDCFSFAATNGQRLVFRAHTRGLGSPCDLKLRLLKSDGTLVTEADATGPGDGALTNTFRESGTFQLSVAELTGHGGSDLAYRVEISPFRRGFELSVETNRVIASPAGNFELKVTAKRHDFDGPIQVSLDGLESGAEVESHTIAEKKNETTLKVKPPATLQPGQMAHFTVVGRAETADGPCEAVATTMPALRRLFPLMRHPPPDLDGWIALGIRGGGAAAGKSEPEPEE